MNNTTKAGIALGCSCIIVLFVVPVVIFVGNDKTEKQPLLLRDLFVMGSNWNVVEYFYGKENIEMLEADLMKVKYTKGSYQDSGGFKLYVAPAPFPTYKMCLSYEVMFGSSEWIKGGKLPGVWLGDIGASGGKHIETGYTIRFMWRAGGDAEVYLYISSDQQNEYLQNIITNNNYGDSLWRGEFKFAVLEWNTISLCIDGGKLKVVINSVTKQIYLNLNSTIVSGIMMHSFYGGNDETWAPSVDSYIYFRKFAVTDLVAW